MTVAAGFLSVRRVIVLQRATFFRVEGTLTDRPALVAAAWLASNAQGFGERIARLGNVALAAPLRMAGGLQAGSTSARMTWMALRGMSEDRVLTLTEEYADAYMRNDVLDVGKDLIKQARKQNRRIVLISDNIDLIVRPLADVIGADDLICNKLEIKRNKATGRLEEPVIGGNLAGQWARAFAQEHEIDLEHSAAYGTQATDSLLLSTIGEPCVVNPDRQLRRLARDHHWPVVQG